MKRFSVSLSTAENSRVTSYLERKGWSKAEFFRRAGLVLLGCQEKEWFEEAMAFFEDIGPMREEDDNDGR